MSKRIPIERVLWDALEMDKKIAAIERNRRLQERFEKIHPLPELTVHPSLDNPPPYGLG